MAARLQQTGIIVDSIVVQTGRLTNVLHPISVVTGGYSFKVDTVSRLLYLNQRSNVLRYKQLENALNIVELETVLRAKDRVERVSCFHHGLNRCLPCGYSLQNQSCDISGTYRNIMICGRIRYEFLTCVVEF